ncbi:unnamed protein product [Microthlaspi erraticum]|uniref:BTB domain-containing protein n=1 Tax=Microthlaspi erraticum TaxID=1685480 RepID=A0A6D2KM53_9BRAS|nr:unnamed protein product [Microthlaspi erraticum]
METSENKELFLGGPLKVLKEQQADVRLKSLSSERDVAAHKLILSARSEVFKKFLQPDICKATSTLETITISELTHEGLLAFVDFIYSDGSKLNELAKSHVMSIYRVAEKYKIPHLGDLCRNEIISSLNSWNALKFLEFAQVPYDYALSNAALAAIKNNKVTISNSAEFKDFVVNHPNLTVEIVKAISAKDK